MVSKDLNSALQNLFAMKNFKSLSSKVLEATQRAAFNTHTKNYVVDRIHLNAWNLTDYREAVKISHTLDTRPPIPFFANFEPYYNDHE